MLERLIEPLRRVARLQHVTILQGAKAYGAAVHQPGELENRRVHDVHHPRQISRRLAACGVSQIELYVRQTGPASWTDYGRLREAVMHSQPAARNPLAAAVPTRPLAPTTRAAPLAVKALVSSRLGRTLNLPALLPE